MEFKLTIQSEGNSRPRYEVPNMASFSDAELLEELGPAQALYGCDTTTGICP